MKRTVVITLDVDTDDDERLCGLVRVVVGEIMRRTLRDGTRVGDVAASLLLRSAGEPQAQPAQSQP